MSIYLRFAFVSIVFAMSACQCGDPVAQVKDTGTNTADASASVQTDASVEGGTLVLDAAVLDSAGCIDEDNDHYYANCGARRDCQDDNPLVFPGATEICDDGVDNDCDPGTPDDDIRFCQCQRFSTRFCYHGSAGTAGVGPCLQGEQICNEAGDWNPCSGEIAPVAEICGDGVDNDCNGVLDNGVTNACGTCGATPMEICGDGIDNNCNGTIDESCDCDPGCLCDDSSCTCHPPLNQPCYTGLTETAGVGACHHGHHDCAADAHGNYSWNACVDEQTPVEEVCGDGLDNDCDGQTDEGDCLCINGGDRSCGSDVGLCRTGTQTCFNGQWTACTGSVAASEEICDGQDNDCDGLVDEFVSNVCGACGLPPAEICDDGIDNDCNGEVDEPGAGCGCNNGDSHACYMGPVSTRSIGQCKDGLQQCVPAEQGYWGPCVGSVLPAVEVCADSIDNDCDGQTDEGCACEDGATRPCLTGTDVGACVRGQQTCDAGSWSDCQGQQGPVDETCNAVDDDCDGAVDEGLLNACGRCPGSDPPCFVEDYNFSDPNNNDIGEGDSDGVSNNPQNPLDPRCAGQALCLDSTVSQLRFMWIAGTNQWFDDGAGSSATCQSLLSACTSSNYSEWAGYADQALAAECSRTIIKMDTITGVVEGTYPSYGLYPSRTAVNTDDGSVWVGNRGLFVSKKKDDGVTSQIWRGNDIRAGSVAHLDAEGQLICRADVMDHDQADDINWTGVRALALDANMDAWVGLWTQAKLYKVSGTELDGVDAYGFPRCKLIPIGADSAVPLSLSDGLGTSKTYGAAIVNDRLWISTLGNGPIRVVNVLTNQIEKTISFGTGAGQIMCKGPGLDAVERTFAPLTYGMAVDRFGNAWYGMWKNNDHQYDAHGVVRVKADGSACDYFANSAPDGVPVKSRSRGVALDAEGNVWAANWDQSSVSEFEQNGGHMGTFSVSDGVTDATNPLGMGVDADGKIWAINYTTKNATRFAADGQIENIYDVGTNAYTYSDFTGMQNSLITRRNGSWTMTYDSGYEDPRWSRVKWTGATPPNTSIAVQARSAASRVLLDSASWTVEDTNNPASILGLVSDERYLQVKIHLRTTDDNSTPVLQSLEVFWEY